ncbi:palmitoyl-protein thioesterase 1 [Cimex lectularius]|uniref:Palmitoyl-protein thioesterase 1 n=1 Tax=Cimex lectularius TaxID=79782 RepID=A0A8I6RGA6_CIMLE|nr:palmitoyl-protein thioesterase 1 [Cimex lectularius]
MLRIILIINLFSFGLGATPIVLWHGMGDSCCNPLSLGSFAKHLEKSIPGVYVKSLQLGSNVFDDVLHGFFMDSNEQVRQACEMILNDERLKDGYNAIGFSQGSQFLRAVAQQCGTKMQNLISFGGQHQGIYGLPKCFYPEKLCNYMRLLLNKFAYQSWVQNEFVQAQYWHDPLREKEYVQGSHFLAEINNERNFNKTYRKGLTSLKNFVMVKFLNDTMVVPSESSWFGFYTPGQAENITALRDSRLYKDNKDRLGLRQMDKEGKLKFLAVEGDHLHFRVNWIEENIIKPYLK